MQLDCTLRSFLLHCRDVDSAKISVLYQANGRIHQRQYQQLIHDYTPKFIRFQKQANFKADVVSILLSDAGKNWLKKSFFRVGIGVNRVLQNASSDKRDAESLLFLVDDNIFVRNFCLADIDQSLSKHPEAAGFSLRLGTNTTYCYPLDQPQALPEFDRVDREILRYQWTAAQYDFAYPLEVSSSAYRKSDIIPLLKTIRFKNPNQLELCLSTLADRFMATQPFLLCYETSVTFCDPVNKVQTKFHNRVGEYQAYTVESLAAKFDAGYRIDIDSYSEFVPNACHQETELVFNKID
jgi:hypothetical protein